MKKIFSFVLIMIVSISAFAQENSKVEKVYRNEFGLDVSGFLRQFIASQNVNPPYYYYSYYPSYYLTYRRHLKESAIRFAVGGEYQSTPSYSWDPANKTEYKNVIQTIDFRLGWEFKSELTTKWKIFYGGDFRYGNSSTKNDASNFSYGYANGSEYKMVSAGVAPLLGIRYQFSKRLSLITEASFSLTWQESSRTDYYTPTGTQYPDKEKRIYPRVKKLSTLFEQPLSIFLTFDL